jgi:SAM-dependent methyltransferase
MRFSIFACKSCTNAWTWPSPRYKDYSQCNFHETSLGGRETRQAVAQLPVQWREALESQVSMMLRYLRQGSRILEIGCGEGLLLEELKCAGFVVIGLEPSRRASQSARKAGLDVIDGYFPESSPNGSFDCVVMSHVLEHWPDPRSILESAVKLIPNGALFLVQTNWLGIVPQRNALNWYAWVPEQHYWHFTPRGIERIASGTGLRTEALEYSSLVHEVDSHKEPLSEVALTTASGGDQFHILLRHCDGAIQRESGA